MSIFRIMPSTMQGSLKVPPSKSHTLRALVLALLAEGKSTIIDPLQSTDTDRMICAITKLGAKVIKHEDRIDIVGTAGNLHSSDDIIDAGNSGIVLRFIGALGALIPTYTVITGDHSIRYSRIIQPLLDGLQQFGVAAFSMRENGFAPLIVKGGARLNYAKIKGHDSQPVSALLLAAAFFPFDSIIEVEEPGERPWIDLTLFWLASVGIFIQHENYRHYKIPGRSKIQGFTRKIPADFSSAAYPIAAALVTGSELKVTNLDMDDVQGDKKFIEILQRMGATIKAENGIIHVKKSAKLQGIHVDINDCIDMITILAVVACFAHSKTIIEGCKVARSKESDRVTMIASELRKMGATIEETPDGLIIEPSPLQGAHLLSHHDHRIALALSVAAMGANSTSILEGVEVVAKTYGYFKQDMKALGVLIE